MTGAADDGLAHCTRSALPHPSYCTRDGWHPPNSGLYVTQARPGDAEFLAGYLSAGV
jgi:hypothetical protein